MSTTNTTQPTSTNQPATNVAPPIAAHPSVEWPPVGGDSTYLSSDLFGGDLFGDELMEMYTNNGQGGSDSGPDMITSGSLAIKDSEGKDGEGLRPSSSFNDFTTLFPPGNENGGLVSSIDTTQMDSATAAALQVAEMSGAEDNMDISSDASSGQGRKRKVLHLPELPKLDSLPVAPTGATQPSVPMAGRPTQQPKPAAAVATRKPPVKNAGFAPTARVATTGGVFHQVKPVEVAQPKRRKAAPKKASVSAASRKAAQAKAVAQFAPLAASQVSKIRQKASLLETSASEGQPVVNPGAVANPLGSMAPVQAPAAAAPVVAVADGRPSSPPSQAPTMDPSSPALVSPGTQTTIVTSTSSQDINAAVAAAALAKANALLSNAKNVAALNVQQIAHPKTEPQPELEELASSEQFPSGTNTSTAHVTALTSSNWAVGSGGPPPAPTSSKNVTAQAQKRRAALTPEDRAKQNRDRNREHARNTRLRKKAYVEELKKTLTEIVAQRDALEIEKLSEKQRDDECRKVRLTVMEEFLKLRGANIQDYRRWSSILDEKFVLNLPQTNYRKMVESSPNRPLSRVVSDDSGSSPQDAISPPVSAFNQTIVGVSKVMEDAAMLSEMLVGFESTKNGAVYCGLAYECQKNRFMMDGTNAIIDWTARTNGAKGQGAAHELVITGNMRASFHAATNKLLSVELSFDTNAVAVQLQSMYPLTFCENSGDHASDADATAALLDSLNVPHLDNFLNKHHPVSSDEHCNESSDSSLSYEAESTSSMTRKKGVQV